MLCTSPIIMQARRLGRFGGSDEPPTAWKGPLGGLLTNNLTGLNLTGLSLTGLNIHYTTPVDLDTVVNCYARLHPCRLQLCDTVNIKDPF